MMTFRLKTLSVVNNVNLNTKNIKADETVITKPSSLEFNESIHFYGEKEQKITININWKTNLVFDMRDNCFYWKVVKVKKCTKL